MDYQKHTNLDELPSDLSIGQNVTIPFYKVAFDCLLYTSDAADEQRGVDLGGRRIIKKKKEGESRKQGTIEQTIRHMNIK